MNADLHVQYQLDFRTGRPTFIYGTTFPEARRSACAALNRDRARGIQEATRPAAPGQSLPPDGWNELVARKARQWGVPLVSLSVFGIEFDGGFMVSSMLERMAEGQEATAWLDREERCVYKLFDLKAQGALGKKLVFAGGDDLPSRVTHSDAFIWDTLEKLCVLHEAGACPTEIVGLSDSGDYLVTKQLLCFPYGSSLEEDRLLAVDAVRAVVPTGSFGERVWVFWQRDQAWVLGDLHKGNIRRDRSGAPTIIDALIGPIPVAILRHHSALQRSVDRARKWMETGTLLSDDPFGGIDDDDL